jgi:predicted amidohydrolase YtcJ
MSKHPFFYLAYLLFFLLISCGKEEADVIIINGNIYTMNEEQPKASAVAVRDGRIIKVGSDAQIQAYKSRDTEVIDLEGKSMIPGFIESHAHLLALGSFSKNLDLSKISSYEEMVKLVGEAVKKAKPGEWIRGRGWHQSKWTKKPKKWVNGYQVHDALSAISPENPVVLSHASGHAVFANAKAMEMAGIGPDSKMGEEGEIIRDENGQPTGIFTENAETLITDHLPKANHESLSQDLRLAIESCLRQGITSFQDAGSDQEAIDLYKEFVQAGKMNIRLWVMLSGSDSTLLKDWYTKGPERGDFLSIAGIKLYSDGALGSRGAWLLEEYKDQPGHFGNPVTPIADIAQIAKNGLKHGFQVCTHAIGDRANHEVLNVYEKAFLEYPEKAGDHRFRIEHAQHLHPNDIPRFAELGVIPSMQAIHMSSDRPWAIDRLGLLRIQQGAYMWKALLESGAHLINGTDAPVEPVDPIPCFYASVTRKTLKGKPDGGYEAEQCMSREEALRSYTLEAAYGAFQENEKGSIEKGKFADFTVLSQDIMSIPKEKILDTKVLMTIVGGKIKFSRE